MPKIKFLKMKDEPEEIPVFQFTPKEGLNSRSDKEGVFKGVILYGGDETGLTPVNGDDYFTDYLVLWPCIKPPLFGYKIIHKDYYHIEHVGWSSWHDNEWHDIVYITYAIFHHDNQPKNTMKSLGYIYLNEYCFQIMLRYAERVSEGF